MPTAAKSGVGAACVVLALAVAAPGGGAAGRTAGCTPGMKSVNGFQARVFCGPAKATVKVNGKTHVFKGGVCERHPAFLSINIGTVVLGTGKGKPKLPYFGLVVGRSPAYPDPPVRKPGTYHRALITFTAPGLDVGLHSEPDLTIVLTRGLASGTFSATQPANKPPTYAPKALAV